MYASEDFFRSEEGTDIQSVVQDKLKYQFFQNGGKSIMAADLVSDL